MSDIAEVKVVDQLVLVATKKIKPYFRNPRINDATVEKLVELIPKVGFNVPLVLDRENVIVKGHARWKAAIQLRMKELPVVYTDADPQQIQLDRITDNKTAEFATWNDDLLMAELAMVTPEYESVLKLMDWNIGMAAIEPLPMPPAPAEPPAGGAVEPPDGAKEPDAPFITEKDVKATTGPEAAEYDEITCNKCGNTMYLRRD